MPCSSSPPSSSLVVIAIEALPSRNGKKRSGARQRRPPRRNRTGPPRPASRAPAAGVATAGTNRARVDTRAAIDRFLASPALADATRRSYRFDLEPFGDWLEGRGLSVEEVDARVLAEFVSHLGRARPKPAPGTVARKLAAVRSFLRFTLGPGRVPEVPLGPRRVRPLPAP